MEKIQINSFDAINNFLFDIYRRGDKVFDLSGDVRSIKDKQGNAVFSEVESNYLNDLLTECFVFCVMNNLNIDTVAAIVQCDFLNSKAAA
ncbi:MAG: hypothetical protein M3R50_01290 [Bacteroidota bacterium]|nr:hypothetical protein [Bacteroidota bacterium]